MLFLDFDKKDSFFIALVSCYRFVTDLVVIELLSRSCYKVIVELRIRELRFARVTPEKVRH